MILLEQKETPIFKLDGYNPLIKTADLDTRINTSKIKPITGGNMKRKKFNIFDKAGDFIDKIIEKKNALTDIDIKLPKVQIEHDLKKAGNGLLDQLKVPLIVLAVGIVVKRMMDNNDRKRRKRKY